jgi:hypothetical protein
MFDDLLELTAVEAGWGPSSAPGRPSISGQLGTERRADEQSESVERLRSPRARLGRKRER